MKKLFSSLTLFEWLLWGCSSLAMIISYFLSGNDAYLNLIASLIGACALIFVAKGHVFGQVMVVIFALFYGMISLGFGYYGEMITYVCMSAPMAILAIISWVRHPYKDKGEVEIAPLTKRKIIFIVISAIIVTGAFYFILKALNTESLLVSTLSVTTSYVACALTFLRSPYYALAYGLNDIVLIILWIIASIENPAYIVMVICFLAFLANDTYGFVNWQRMKRAQSVDK